MVFWSKQLPGWHPGPSSCGTGLLARAAGRRMRPSSPAWTHLCFGRALALSPLAGWPFLPLLAGPFSPCWLGLSPLAGWAKRGTPSSPPCARLFPQMKSVTPAEAARLAQAGKCRILDVRTAQEFSDSAPRGAVNAQFYRLIKE